MNLKRIFKRIKEEVKATYKISKVTSLRKGFITFMAKLDIQKLAHKIKKEDTNTKNRLLKKHDILLEYYTKTFGKYLTEYDYDLAKKSVKKASKYKDVIWVCWWQGIDNAPTIVKECINSIKCGAGNKKVILITLNNYKEYIDVPNFVEEKIEKGIITLTNFSDLLRLSLLSKYGGLWLDATFYCKEGANLGDYFGDELWSIKRPDYGHTSVACGNFGGYSMYCNEKNRWMFKVIRDFFLHYWETNDFMVDYLMIDYMIVLAQKNNNEIAKAFDNIKPNNPNCDELCKVLNDEFDEEKWNLILENTNLFKLTWKKDFDEMKNNRKTFYGKIVNHNK